jgi:hypothetical protein
VSTRFLLDCPQCHVLRSYRYTGIASHRAPVRSALGGAALSTTLPLLERALNSVRRQASQLCSLLHLSSAIAQSNGVLQAEAMDTMNGLLLVHSLGGGTGAGLGSRLLEALRDDYAEYVTVQRVRDRA